MRRQIRRHSTRRASSRRRLGRLWSRLFHRGTRLRGQIPLLTPPGATHPSLTRSHSYQAVGGSGIGTGLTPSPCSSSALGLALQAHTQALYQPPTDSPPTPSPPHSASDSQEEEESGAGSPEAEALEGGDSQSGSPSSVLSDEPGTSRQQCCTAPKNLGDTYNRRASRKLVQGLAVNLALRRYVPLGISPGADPRPPTTPIEGHAHTLSQDQGPSGTLRDDQTCHSVEFPIQEEQAACSGTNGDEDESLLIGAGPELDLSDRGRVDRATEMGMTEENIPNSFSPKLRKFQPLKAKEACKKARAICPTEGDLENSNATCGFSPS
ncbi:hypothetical protein JZ751_018306 [Albula glossodonta]|uniref:Uncharacterized protein n=1 Tax=Albula glossodonta TaxID=121402 RepID=A0A8T2NX21_9TELE|nr:hypothetical protein JZ751_018306 [Albula glossodonta]